jgi:fatty acid desaturase
VVQSPNADYIELKRRITTARLLDRQGFYYALTVSLTVGALLASFAVLLLIRNPLVWLLDVLVMAFLYGQVGLLGHDACHNGVFRSARANRLLAIFLDDFLIGLSSGWWRWNHNNHHANSNEVDVDPDTHYPVFAFTNDQALRRPPSMWPWIARQHRLVFALLPAAAYSLRIQSYYYLRARSTGRLERAMFGAHWLAYLGFILWAVGPGWGSLLIVLHQLAGGAYVAGITEPNHWGRPTAQSLGAVTFLRRQVITSRNIRGGWWIDLWCGGLNWQIEHHLFPSMPRNSLRKASQIVRPYCEQLGIHYHVNGFFEAWRESEQTLSGVAAFMRAQLAAAH